jgi:multidrug transporter EmrE-like cation transporter
MALVGFQFAPVIRFEAPEVKYIRQVPAWDVKFFAIGYFFFVIPILGGIAAGLSLIAIFLYRKRNLQSIFCLLAIFFHLLAVGYIFYFFQTKETPIDIVYTVWNLVALPPVVLLGLAYWAIQKDEALVKSMDRLRD